MSAFQALEDASNKFREEIQRSSAELFSARVGESFEDGVAKKLRDLTLFTSKMRLLRAKPLALSPQITEQEKEKDTVLSDYGEMAKWKVVEQQVVKSATQAHAVKTLVTTSDSSLNPELVERKRKIMDCLANYIIQEDKLQNLDSLLRERENELVEVRAKWDKEMGELRDMRAGATGTEEVDSSGPLYGKLRTLVGKMELMRWLMSKLVLPRTRGYDWLGDPHRKLNALKLAREPVTIDTFTRPS